MPEVDPEHMNVASQTADKQPFAVNTYSYTLTHGAAACPEHLADRGFTEFELMLHPGHLWLDESSRSQRQTLDRVLAKRGLRIISLNTPNLDLFGSCASTLERMGRRVPVVLEITSTSPDSDIAHSVERLLDCGWRDWT